MVTVQNLPGGTGTVQLLVWEKSAASEKENPVMARGTLPFEDTRSETVSLAPIKSALKDMEVVSGYAPGRSGSIVKTMGGEAG